MDDATATALANEARRQTVKQAIAELRGRIDNASSLMVIISGTLQDANMALERKQVELTAIEAGAGPGITEEWGSKDVFISAYVASVEAAQTPGVVEVDEPIVP